MAVIVAVAGCIAAENNVFTVAFGNLSECGGDYRRAVLYSLLIG